MSRSAKLLVQARTALFITGLVFLVVGSSAGLAAASENPSTMAVGAYYLTGWGLYSGQKSSDWNITSPYLPELGSYNSANPATTNKHIEWALNHGISFFVIPFTHAGYGWETALEDGFLRSESISKIEFAIMTNYEPYWSSPTGFPQSNDERMSWMLNDISYIADHYATHPSYMRVGDRPVLFVYHASTSLSQSLGGIEKLSQFIESVREKGRERGIDFYLIGDVMYWLPLETDESYAKLFDAVSAYTLPDAGVGWTTENGHLRSIGPYDVMVQSYVEMTKHWSELANSLGIGFIPPVTPGFNNTDTYDLGIDNYLVVRSGSSPEKFAQMVDGVASYVDTHLEMMIVEAWNEYHEGSVVEPTKQFGFAYLDAFANRSNTVPAPEYAAASQSLMLLVGICGVLIFPRKRSSPTDMPP